MKRQHRWVATLLLIAVVAVCATAGASEGERSAAADSDGLLSSLSLSSEKGPVIIEADQLEFDYRSRTLTYRGNVKVEQGDLSLRSDLLRVVLDESAEDRVRHVVAEGAVRMSQGKRLATGGRAVFDQSTRTVVLDRDAVVREGLNEVAGQKVTVYLDERRSVVEGGVQARLFPAGDVPAEERDAD